MRVGVLARSAIVIALVGSIACKRSPDMSTPEGVGVRTAQLLRARDFDSFVAIAENPNAALLRETGARPQRGSYAELMQNEGRQMIRAEFDRVAGLGIVPEATLKGVVSEVSSNRWDVVLAREDGAVIGLTVRVARVENVLKVVGLETTNAH